MRRLPVSLALLFLLSLPAKPAGAGELQLAFNLAGDGTTWSPQGDGAGLAGLRLGYRFIDLVGIYFLGRVGYATIDQRLLVSLQVGAQLWGRLGSARPYLRFGLLHNHEEPFAAVESQPSGAVLGVGDGIRHRTGVEAGAGIDLPMFKRKRIELYATLEATAAWLTYSSGPAWYWGGALGFGFNYAM